MELSNVKNKKVSGKCIIYALLVYVIFEIGDPGVGIILSQVLKLDFSEMNASVIMLFLIICSLIWATEFFFMQNIAKKKLNINIWESKEKPSVLQWVISILILAASIAENYISSENQIRIVWEYNLLAGYAGNMAWLAFILQYIYYLFEMALVFLIIVFSHKGLENISAAKFIPWGGIGAGIIWGLPHAITQGALSQGMWGLIKGIAFGVIFLLMKKNVRYVYPFMYLMFLV